MDVNSARMKNKMIEQTIWYSVLALVMILGALFVWNSNTTIFTNIAKQKETQKPAEIKLTLVNPIDCKTCVDGESLLKTIEQQNVRILETKTVVQDSEDASSLIKTFGIEKLPTVIVKGDYKKENVKDFFSKLGGNEKDNTLIIQPSQPIYYDLVLKQAIGSVDIIYVTNSDCKECFDPTKHKAILQNNFSMTIQGEKNVDVKSSEGRALLNTYHIEEIPTVLISKNANAYTSFVNAWKQVGTIEQDGMFVFRDNTALGPVVYKNLKTGEIIRPANPKP